MRKLLLLSLLNIFYLFTYAQDHQHIVNLSRYDKLGESIYLGQHGFLLRTGEKLLYFTKEGKLIWEKQIEIHPKISRESIVVAAPDGSIVYNVESRMYDFAGEKHYLTQIKRTGELKTFEITMGDDYGKSLQSVFCDDQFLYYLATEHGDEYHHKKKVGEKLIMHRFSHNGLSHKKFILDLPEINNPTETSFWSYAGQNKQGKYLVSKRMIPEINEQLLDLIIIDTEGKVVKQIAIRYETGDKYIRPAKSVSMSEGKESHLGSRNLVNLAYKGLSVTSMTVPGGGGGPQTTTYSASDPFTNAAFGYIQLDDNNEDIVYIYGLLGPKPYRHGFPLYEGFYVYKYNFDGTPLWKLHNISSEELLNVKYYTVNGPAANRFISLNSHPDQRRTFSIRFTQNLSKTPELFLFEISENGQLIETRSTKDKSEEPYEIAALTPRAKNYIKKQTFKKHEEVSYNSFLTPGGEVLLLTNRWEKKLSVMFFQN